MNKSYFEILNITPETSIYDIHDLYQKHEYKNDPIIFNAYQMAIEMKMFELHSYDKNTLKLYIDKKIEYE